MSGVKYFRPTFLLFKFISSGYDLALLLFILSIASIFLINGQNRAKKAIIRNTKDIGFVKNVDKSPADTTIARLKFVSQSGPNTIPIARGATG